MYTLQPAKKAYMHVPLVRYYCTHDNATNDSHSVFECLNSWDARNYYGSMLATLLDQLASGTSRHILVIYQQICIYDSTTVYMILELDIHIYMEPALHTASLHLSSLAACQAVCRHVIT